VNKPNFLMEIGKGLQIRILKLETLIAVKEQTAGEKDKAALIILRRTLQERIAKEIKPPSLP